MHAPFAHHPVPDPDEDFPRPEGDPPAEAPDRPPPQPDPVHIKEPPKPFF
jgi:hypothetical protein